MSLLEVVVMGLAVWRLSYLVAHERGPFGSLRFFRVIVGAKTIGDITIPDHIVDRLYDDESDITTNHDNQIAATELAELVMCQWCNSVWLGILATALNLLLPDIAVYLLLPFALSAAALIVQNHME